MNIVGVLQALHRASDDLQVHTLRACDVQVMVVAIAEGGGGCANR